MSKKLTHEEFIARVIEKNEHVLNGEIEILGRYNGRAEKIECHCNTHDVTWNIPGYVLYQGGGCQRCKADKLSVQKLKPHEEFIREVFEKNDFVRNGQIEVLGEYVGTNTKIKCRCVKHDYCYSVAPSSLLNNIGCKKCGRERTTLKQTKSHEQFVEEAYAADPTTIVVGVYISSHTPIDFMCPSKHVYSMNPIDFLNGERCPYCSGRKVWVGFNDLWTTKPDVAALLTNPEDGHRYTCHSRQKVNFTCPLCGEVQYKQIDLVTRREFSCNRCSDFLSFPNRFGRAFFDQVDVDEYDTEWQPRWAKPYYYDVHFELNGISYVVEWDGKQHFEDRSVYKTTLQERQERDRVKNELATQHGFEIIRIDCSESSGDYIKTNIVNSKLNELFDLSNIDWILCEKNAHKNLVKEACNLYEFNTKNYSEIAKQLHIGESTARSYIRRGIKLGWCQYDMDKFATDRKKRHGYAVKVQKQDNGAMYSFSSFTSCSNSIKDIYDIKIDVSTISKYCDTGKAYKGFLFNRADSTIQN